ncbi:hypothetical protein VPH35_069189 [Triticum aestivum]
MSPESHSPAVLPLDRPALYIALPRATFLPRHITHTATGSFLVKHSAPRASTRSSSHSPRPVSTACNAMP